MSTQDMKKIITLLFSHGIVFALGFSVGIYTLPVLIAPQAPDQTEVIKHAEGASYTTTFRRDLKGSDSVHWGEGSLSIGKDAISFMGKLAPGPDYRLYLAPEYVEDGARFKAIKNRSVQVGNVKTFENFIVKLPNDINPAEYTTAVVWCETFSRFISAGTYR